MKTRTQRTIERAIKGKENRRLRIVCGEKGSDKTIAILNIIVDEIKRIDWCNKHLRIEIFVCGETERELIPFFDTFKAIADKQGLDPVPPFDRFNDLRFSNNAHVIFRILNRHINNLPKDIFYIVNADKADTAWVEIVRSTCTQHGYLEYNTEPVNLDYAPKDIQVRVTGLTNDYNNKENTDE